MGRKTLSDLWVGNLIPEIFCSVVRPDMLLGELVDFRVTDKSYIVFYRAFTAEVRVLIVVTVVNGIIFIFILTIKLVKVI